MVSSKYVHRQMVHPRMPIRRVKPNDGKPEVEANHTNEEFPAIGPICNISNLSYLMVTSSRGWVQGVW